MKPKTEVISAEEIANEIDPLKRDAVLQASLKACRLCGGVGLTSVYGPKPCPACGAGGGALKHQPDTRDIQREANIREILADIREVAAEREPDNIREMVEAVREVWNQHKRTEDRIMRLMARIEELAGVPIGSILRNP